jgi:hypothetical protein
MAPCSLNCFARDELVYMVEWLGATSWFKKWSGVTLLLPFLQRCSLISDSKGIDELKHH